MNTTPVSLLKKLRTPGEEGAWTRFVQLYTPLLYHWALSVGLQEQDASDLIQDVFVLLIQKLPQFEYDPKRSFRAWLRTVALNRLRDTKRTGRLDPKPKDPRLLEGQSQADPLESFWEEEYQQMLLSRALTIMQAEFQSATWRACWETIVGGRPAAEVAQELGLSENAVYIAKCRVLKRLRQELDGLWE